MSVKYGSPVDFLQNELQQARIQNLATDPISPVVGQIWFNTSSNQLKVYDGAVRVLGELNNTLNQFGTPTTALSVGGQLVSNVATPVSGTDAATKAYVDNAQIGLDVKASVLAATTGAGTLSSSFANGSVIDGVTLATGNRILVKNQATASENGIYVVNSSGAPTRSSDFNSSTNAVAGSFVFVESGSINQGAAFVVQTQGTITPGTTGITFVQFAGASSGFTGSLSGDVTGTQSATVVGKINGVQLSSLSTGLLKNTTSTGAPTIAAAGTDYVVPTGSITGTSAGVSGSQTANTFLAAPNGSAGTATFRTIVPADVPTLNQPTTASAGSLSSTLGVTGGGTGATGAAAARTNLGAPGKYAATIGDNSTSSIVVTHNLGTTDVVVGVSYVATPFQVVIVETQLTTTNTITLVFGSAPATSSIRVVVIG